MWRFMIRGGRVGHLCQKGWTQKTSRECRWKGWTQKTSRECRRRGGSQGHLCKILSLTWKKFSPFFLKVPVFWQPNYWPEPHFWNSRILCDLADSTKTWSVIGQKKLFGIICRMWNAQSESRRHNRESRIREWQCGQRSQGGTGQAIRCWLWKQRKQPWAKPCRQGLDSRQSSSTELLVSPRDAAAHHWVYIRPTERRSHQTAGLPNDTPLYCKLLNFQPPVIVSRNRCKLFVVVYY